MKSTGRDLLNVLSAEALDGTWEVLMPICVTVAAHAVFLVPPSINLGVREQNHRMSASAGDLIDLKVDERLDKARGTVTALVAMPKFAIHPTTPSKQSPCLRHRRCMIRPAGHLLDALATEGLNNARDVLVVI